MTIEQIILDIDQLEQMLFFHTLQPLAIEELEQLQKKVKELKEAFLGTCFVGISVAELEDMRFKLAEITFGIEISIKEKLQQDVTADMN